MKQSEGNVLRYGGFFQKIAVLLLLFFLFSAIIHAFLLEGLKRYYCLKPATILCIGHSMTEMGVDKEQLERETGFTVAKYCMNGAGAQERLIMIQHYLEHVGTVPKLILYDITPRLFSEELSRNSHALFYPFITESKAVSRYLQTAAPLDDYWQKVCFPLCRYDDTRLGAVLRGWRGDWKNRSWKQFSPADFAERIRKGTYPKLYMNGQSQQSFEETLQLLNRRNIPVILVDMPTVDLLNQAEPEKAQKVRDYFAKMSQRYPNVHVVDMNTPYEKQYALFSDPIHLDVEGQRKLTHELAVFLAPYMTDSVNR